MVQVSKDSLPITPAKMADSAKGLTFTRIVGPDGTDSTIAAAISNATAGDAIFIKRGTFTEQITVNKDNLTFFGESTNSVIIDGTDGAAWDDNANGTTYKNLTVKTDATGGGSCWELTGATKVKIDNCAITEGGADCIRSTSAVEDGHVITNCDFETQAGSDVNQVIYLAGGNNRISNCNIVNGVASQALFLDVNNQDSVVTNCRLRSAGAAQGSVFAGDNISVTNCNADGATNDFAFTAGSNTCVVTGCATDSAILNTGTGNVIGVDNVVF